MSTWGIPQVFAIWRKSVLFTVGAISLGAEQLEQKIGKLLKPVDRDRAPRVKVPVHGTRTRVAAPAVTRRGVRGARKSVVTRTAKATRVNRKAAGRKPRGKVAAAHPANVETSATNQ